MKTYALFYANGRWRPCHGSDRMPLVDPSSGLPAGQVIACSAQDAELAVASARRAFASWSLTCADERRAVLARLHAELEQRSEAVAQSLAADIGCPLWLGRSMQMSMPLKGLEFAMAGLEQITWRERIGNGLVERVPAGVVAAITPWNFPLHQMVAKVAAAIAAGCTVVLKPSEVAPGVAELFMRALDACSLPPGVVNLVWGSPDIARQLVTHPQVDRISFTGSTAVGQRIMAAAAPRLTPLTLELGGKSAAVLLDDADLDAAIPSVLRLCMANSGQTCVSQSRLLVPRHWLPDIVQRLQAAAGAWPLGHPLDEATRLGPVATQAQHRRVTGMVERARQQGAVVCLGATAPPQGLGPGFYVAPTVLSEVRPEMELAREEVFGPVLALMAYDSDDEAAGLANATAYGLSGAVWSRDGERATQFARRLKTGQVVINGATQNLATPFGGWGASGFGRENGRFGIEELLSYRSLHGAA